MTVLWCGSHTSSRFFLPFSRKSKVWRGTSDLRAKDNHNQLQEKRTPSLQGEGWGGDVLG